MKTFPGRTRFIIGLMSGTSADGIDVSLGRVAEPPQARNRPTLENFATLPYPREVRASILRIAEGATTTAQEISQLNFRLGQVFGNAILKACRKFRISPARISLVGSHGQTVYHQGASSRFLGAPVASTFQIGEPAIIAAITGIVTVGDFRQGDMAAGGQGAPLVPWVDYLLYRDERKGRVVLNIGGIANFTVIPRSARPQQVYAFDTGPGNMLVDGLVRRFTNERELYDKNARMAMRGKLLPALLEELLQDAYFKLRPPKSAGREQYGQSHVKGILDWGLRNRARPEDMVHTVTLLTPISIAEAVKRWVLPRIAIQEVLVSGGGARNPLIMAQLAGALPNIDVIPTESVGMPGDAKEAFAFALLANETVHGRPANLPSATGAKRPAILGKICYPPPR